MLFRFEFTLPPDESARLWVLVPAMVAGRLAALWSFRVFQGSWRHAGLRDGIALAKATALGSCLGVLLVVLSGGINGLSRSVLLADPILFFGLAGALRLTARLANERRATLAASNDSRRRVLVVGVDDSAARFVRQCHDDTESTLLPVGLISIGRTNTALAIHGVRVVGTVDDIANAAQRLRAELLVIAVSTASGEQMREIVRACEQSGCEFKVAPTMRELLETPARPSEVRDLKLDDLLGRRPVQLCLDVVERDISNATVLVTGAAGSIGSELVRQIAGFGPARIIMLEQAESPLFFMEHELRNTFPVLKSIPVVADVADRSRIEQVFTEYAPDVVFHAAAYKHVPMMEAHPGEAIRNNVIGTLNVAAAAVRHGARKFVLISTDKAVNPSSVMGTTKRLAELIILGHPAVRGRGTDFRAVRFGNVLGSAGSVIPLFQRQLVEGGPLTVTHRDVRRYFMTIPEAVELVLQAGALPEASGRITMLDMGEPVRIVELAEQLIRLSGKVPHRDVQIAFTGLREGEKMNEDLMSLLEEGTPTTVDQIRILRSDGLSGKSLEEGLRRLSETALSADANLILRAMQQLVPEFTPRFREIEIPRHLVVEPGGASVRDPRTANGRRSDRGAGWRRAEADEQRSSVIL